MRLGCFDKKLAAEVPNRYNLTPQSIKQLVIKDWDELRKRTWHNEAMRDTGSWWCHLEGCDKRGGRYDDSDEFWIGFREEDNTIDCNFTCYEGMCKYTFDSFYDSSEIENKYDMGVQVNTLRWMNRLLDDGVLAIAGES